MAFNNLKDNFSYSKRNIIIALTLGIIILALPLSYKAILNQQQIIKSRAAEGKCTATPQKTACKQNNKVDVTVNWEMEVPEEAREGEGTSKCNVEFINSDSRIPTELNPHGNIEKCSGSAVIPDVDNGRYEVVLNNGKTGCINKIIPEGGNKIEVSCQQSAGGNLTVQCNVSKTRAALNESISWIAQVKLGSEVQFIQDNSKITWEGIGRQGATGSVVLNNISTPGRYKANVTVRDSGQTAVADCPEVEVTSEAGSGPAPGSIPAPAGQCTLSHRATAPVLTSSCASCIIANAPGAISFIRGERGNEACTVEDAVNHWCNGGVEGGQANCTDIKNISCNIACGGAGGGVCNLDSTRMTVSPEQARPGERVTFTAGGVGVTWIEDEFGGGVRDCSFEPDATNSRYIRNCTAGNNSGSYTWLHKWGPSERAQKCGKPQTYTILAANTNNAACGTFKVNNSTDQATVAVGSQFDVSLIMNNPTGSKTWKTSENYRLAKVDGDWALPDVNRNRVSLPTSEISAGNTATFNFRLTAPNTAGSFPLNLRMVQDGVEFFGAACSKSITVGAAASSPSPSPSPQVSPSPSPQGSPSPGPLACVVGDLNKNGCIDRGFDGGDFQTWLRIVTGQPTGSDAGKGDVFPACTGDGKKDINDFNLWFVEYLNNRNICR